MNAASQGLETGSARPTPWWFVLCLTVLVGVYFLWGELSGQAHLSQEPNPGAFSRDLAAHRMLSGFAERGAGINRDLLAAYEARLVRHFPAGSALDEKSIPATGHVLSLDIAEPDLHDPRFGIMANGAKRGLLWERPGIVSLYRDG